MKTTNQEIRNKGRGVERHNVALGNNVYVMTTNKNRKDTYKRFFCLQTL